MTTASETPNEGVLVRRMHQARVRQWAVAGISVLVTALGVAFLSPDEIGPFSYYTLVALMLLNAVIALRQGACVIFPIEKLLRRIRQIERAVDEGRLDVGHFSISSNDAFACLAAGIDNLVTQLSEKARVSTERMLANAAKLQATPFTILTVSNAGKVYAVIKDQFGLVPLLGIKVGEGPTAERWGGQNAAKYLREVANSFKEDDFRWFDLDVGTHHLRGCARRINELTALVEIGDLPAIDKTVAEMTGVTGENDFTHRQNSLKRFAAAIAHDGRNVFAALSNLVETYKTSSDPQVRAQVPLAEDAIRRGTGLLSELSAFAGETRLNLVCVPAAEGLRPIVESPSIRALLPANVRLITSISDKEMPEIDLDADQAWKVGSNLVKNAVEAMKGNGGRIWANVEPCLMTEDIARSFRHSGTLRNGKGVLITVSDDGPGIATEMIGRIFDPYYSSKGEGRGIGLATVMTIVDAHSGGLSVKSSPGYGTTFYIYLPASRNTADEIRLMKEIAPNGEILLVDDDPTILHTTSLVLRALKIAAHPANNENDALTKLRSLRSRVKAVLVDANLQCVSSAGLVRRIHAEFDGLPVVVVSGSPKETIDERFSGVPYDWFLSKPYSVAELSEALKAASKA